jgi:1-deoxy-D-xylulose-5-phosphate synthase
MSTLVSSEAPTATQRLLDGIQSPDDIKALSEEDLPQLAQEVRNELIEVLSKTGGHLGPNLGVVELTIALHRVFNTPHDKFVFDVSHQGYVHKMFTGRLDRFHTMRQYGGLNGFLLRTESEHDAYGAGHAGTALSAALGMAVDAISRVAMRISWSWPATPPLPAASAMRR